MSIIIKETISGCGEDWYNSDVVVRQGWLNKHLGEDTYRVWYGGLDSDDRYTRFNNDEDALAYKIVWIKT